jgi:hypothetical protein
MIYEISREVRTLAIQLENKRKERANELSGKQNSTSTKEQTSSHQQDVTKWREEVDYREGFRYPLNKASWRE